MAPADAPANSETEAVAEGVQRARMTPMVPNTAEVEAVVEEEVAEMVMAPADAPANSSMRA